MIKHLLAKSLKIDKNSASANYTDGWRFIRTCSFTRVLSLFSFVRSSLFFSSSHFAQIRERMWVQALFAQRKGWEHHEDYFALFASQYMWWKNTVLKTRVARASSRIITSSKAGILHLLGSFPAVVVSDHNFERGKEKSLHSPAKKPPSLWIFLSRRQAISLWI